MLNSNSNSTILNNSWSLTKIFFEILLWKFPYSPAAWHAADLSQRKIQSTQSRSLCRLILHIMIFTDAVCRCFWAYWTRHPIHGLQVPWGHKIYHWNIWYVVYIFDSYIRKSRALMRVMDASLVLISLMWLVVLSQWLNR